MELVLKSGDVLRFDAEDAALILPYEWSVYKNRTRHGKAKCVVTITTLHRLLMDAKPGVIVDHINGDPLDNRKCNLRLATRTQNAQNQGSHRGTSRFKGVSWARGRKSRPWVACIYADGKKRNLGYFATEEEAAKVYNDAAIKYFGEFAWLNEL